MKTSVYNRLSYKFDSRSPNEIVTAGGFFPNPEKNAYTLAENSLLRVNGGGNWVSATLNENNGFIAASLKREVEQENLPFGKEDIKKNGSIYSRYNNGSEVEIENIKASEVKIYKVFKSFEYRIQDVTGVKMDHKVKAHADLREVEVIFNKIDRNSIAAFREVYIVNLRFVNKDGSSSGTVSKILYKNWQPMPTSETY